MQVGSEQSGVSALTAPIRTLWAETQIRVWPEPYWLVSAPHGEFSAVVQLLRRSIARGAPFGGLITEPDEVSLTLAETEWLQASESTAHTAAAGPYRVLTFLAMDLSVSGYLAPGASRLAAAGISIVPQCAYQKDHLLIQAEDTDRAMAILGHFITECRSSLGNSH